MRQYKLYTNTTGSNNGVTSLRVTKAGRIRAITFVLAGVAGAANTGHMQVEVSKQNTSNLAINDTPETVIASCALAFNVVSGAVNTNQVIPMDVPITPGDTIYLNTVFTGGTAPASTSFNVYLGV